MADDSSREIARFAPPRIAYHPAVQERFGIDQAGWRALIDAVWPGARTAEAVVLALSYCKARKLDPFKRPVHIVGVWSREQKRVVESCWPGIGELRTTAFRTGLYAGRNATEWGPDREANLDGIAIIYPEWAQVTVHRLDKHGQARPYPGPRVYWIETYAVRNHDTVAPNEMWRRRTRGQLDKVAEAAALRAAFPEELGNDYAAEEMEGQVVDHAPAVVAAEPTLPALRGNQALRSRLQPEEPPPSVPDARPTAAEIIAATFADDPTFTDEKPRRGRPRRKSANPADEPPAAEIERSQEMIEAVPEEIGPEEIDPEEIAQPDEETFDPEEFDAIEEPEEVAPPPMSVFVPFDAAEGNIQEWFSRARGRLREMERAGFEAERFVAYRKANAGALMRLSREYLSFWQQLDNLILAGERRR